MAEQTSAPALPSTADATPYVPISWMAVSALVVAVAFAVVLISFGIAAFVNKKPLLEEQLLVLPAIAIVLSFTARRAIRNSEGTRTGEKLANTAWWLALIFGVCYAAYLLAVGFAIRKDARAEAEKWIGLVIKGDEESITRSFHLTLPPGERQNVSPGDIRLMRERYRNELIVYTTSDLLRIAQRNKGELAFTYESVTWSYRAEVMDCVLVGKVSSPEGSFPLVITMRGFDGGTGPEAIGRQWMIVRPRGSNFIDPSEIKRTPYGWLLWLLEQEGGAFAKGFISYTATGPSGQPFVFRSFMLPGGYDQGWPAVAANRDPYAMLLWHLAFSVPMHIEGDAGYVEYMKAHFFRFPGNREPTDAKKAEFFASWNSHGLRPSGEKLRTPDGNPMDKEDVLTLTDTAVQVSVPVEIVLAGRVEPARGRVIVECNDAALLAELKQLKAAADPSQGNVIPPEGLSRRSFVWRVVRVESDMQPISLMPQGAGGGGGQHGPGQHGGGN